eukprot:403368489
MEFPFNCEKVLGVDAEGFAILDGRKGASQMQQQNKVIQRQLPELQSHLHDIIDKMGHASTKAQGLPAVITTAGRLFTSDNRLYLRAEGNKVIGLLKVGVKKLFIRNEMGAIKEISPMCVLDFYVHESVQRGGQGKALFEKMLENEGVKPESLGYDKPSEKLLGFLAKHYGLKRYVPQNNNYVVFSAYFEQQSNVRGGVQSSIDNQKQIQQQTTNSFFNGFGSQQDQRRNQQQNTSPYAQTMYNPKTNNNQSNPNLQSQTKQESQITNNIFGTTNNFYSHQQSQGNRIGQHSNLPPKPQQKSDQSSLTNAGGQQIFGSAVQQQNRTNGSAYSDKRSSTTDRVFGGVMTTADQGQKENNYKRNQNNIQLPPSSNSQSRRGGQLDSVSSLMQDMQSMGLNDNQLPKNQSHIKNGQDYQLSKVNSRLSDNELILKKTQEEMLQLMMKSNYNQTNSGGFGNQSNSKNTVLLQRPVSGKSQQSIVAPYVYIPENSNPDQTKNQQGPTSFTAAGGDYMKRTQFATLNDDITQRLNDNQKFVQLQKEINNGARIPWASYNYQNSHYKR